ncbi:MAG: hypothetical protein ACYTG6_03665 [Planctomycetota bacterium]|jgi:hypothetical protein
MKTLTPVDVGHEARLNTTHRALWFALATLLIMVLVLVLALVSSGAGHGSYVFAKALFPVPMLTTLLTGDRIAIPSIALALVQFPFYALLLAWAARGRRLGGVAAGLVLTHLVAALACFTSLTNF